MKNTFGLDIGTTAIKTVWLSRDGEKIALKSCLSAFSPEKGMLSENPFDQEDMAAALRSLVDDAGISAEYATLALPDNHVFTRVIDMPVLTDKELSAAIYYEAEQYIPVPLNTVTLSWQVLRKQDPKVGEPKMQVLLVGAPTRMIERYQSVLNQAGITIGAIETEVISVARAIVPNEDYPSSLIVNIGALSTSLSIIQHGIIVFTYTMPLGGVAMNRAIASDFGFTPAQAEEYKNTYGITKENLSGKIRHAIEPILTSILTEIRKALTFYNAKYKDDMSVSQIVLAGGTAKLPGITSYFVENSAIETIIANPWKAWNIQDVPEDVSESSSEYAVAVGLALKEYD